MDTNERKRIRIWILIMQQHTQNLMQAYEQCTKLRQLNIHLLIFPLLTLCSVSLCVSLSHSLALSLPRSRSFPLSAKWKFMRSHEIVYLCLPFKHLIAVIMMREWTIDKKNVWIINSKNRNHQITRIACVKWNRAGHLKTVIENWMTA